MRPNDGQHSPKSCFGITCWVNRWFTAADCRRCSSTSRRASGFVRGTCCLSFSAARCYLVWCYRKVRGFSSLCGVSFQCVFLLLLQLFLPLLLTLFLHFLLVPSGFLHQNFKVFDLFLYHSTVLGRRHSKSLKKQTYNTVQITLTCAVSSIRKLGFLWSVLQSLNKNNFVSDSRFMIFGRV